MTRLGIDTGGTFTDAVSSDGRTVKLASTPDDPSLAVASAVEELVPGGASCSVVHGTTVATNALLQGRLSPVGVITNRGFKDLLAIGRQARPELYALEPRRPALPVPPGLATEVSGRLDVGGQELEPLDQDEVRRAGRRLLRSGARALVVHFLNSHADPVHEASALQALASLGVPACASAALNPEFREFERGVTAVINAGLLPVVARYLEQLGERLAGRGDISVMTSEGGSLPTAAAAREPARLLLSGPAAGLVAGRAWARACGFKGAAMTLDMGGTSTDVALLPGELPLCPQMQLAGLPIRIPGLDIHTIGAGGGSIARRDAGGALAVGPESAGADPGPAAYGRETEVTVTDAHLLLGQLAPRFFAGGEAALDPAPAERHSRALARRLGLQPRALLRGILALADVAMTRALRVISVERGHDPRGDVLVAFGGAGGLHAVGLARALGLRHVLVPLDAGVLSARGLLWAPPARTRSRTVLRDPLPSAAERKRLARPLLEELRAGFREAGFAARQLSATVRADLRYRGQSFELQLAEGPELESAFHAAHAERYGFDLAGRPVELVALRCTVSAAVPPPEIPRLPRRRGRRPPAVGRTRPLSGTGTPLPVHDRDDLRAGDHIAGPSLVADHTGTLLLDAGSRARVHATGALLVEVRP